MDKVDRAVEGDAAPLAISALAPLRFPIFLSLWLTSIGSSFGTIVQTMAASWLMVTITDSSIMVAMVQAAASLPVMLFALLAGACADSFNRRTLMLSAQIVGLIGSVTLAGISLMGSVGAWLLLLFTFLIGTGSAFYLPTWQSSIGLQVPRPLIPPAVALNAIGFNLARCAAPALGGVLIARCGPPGAFLVNAGTYFVAVTVLLFWRLPAPVPEDNREPILASMVSGVRYIMFAAPLRATLLYCLLYTFCVASVWAFIPLVTRQFLDGTISTYAITLSAFGIGALAGGLSGARIRARLGAHRAATLGCLISALSILVIGVSIWTPVTSVALFVAGGLWVFTIMMFNVTMQMVAPSWLTGRALACYQTTVFAGLALGSLGWGALAELAGLHVAIVTAGGTLLAGTMLLKALSITMPSNDSAPTPAGSVVLPQPKAVVADEDGPIMISIAYRVDSDRSAEFFDSIGKLRAMRRRDGASSWTILRDIDDPDVWTEIFRIRSWGDYLRATRRMTGEGQALRRLVRSFDVRGEPTIHRYLQHDQP